MRIAKAKLKDGALLVEMEDADDAFDKKVSMRSLGTVHPDLSAAFSDLVPEVREILEWPSNLYQDAMTISGISWSISENTGVEGAVISGMAKLEGCHSPFTFNTPFLPFELYNEENPDQPVMPDGAQDALARVRKEVELYINGKREQPDLFQEIGEAHGMSDSVISAARREAA